MLQLMQGFQSQLFGKAIFERFSTIAVPGPLFYSFVHTLLGERRQEHLEDSKCFQQLKREMVLWDPANEIISILV